MQVVEIGIAFHPVIVGIAQLDGLRKRLEGVIRPVHQGIGAAEVVPDEVIGRALLAQLEVDLQAFFIFPGLRIKIRQRLKDFNVFRQPL